MCVCFFGLFGDGYGYGLGLIHGVCLAFITYSLVRSLVGSERLLLLHHLLLRLLLLLYRRLSPSPSPSPSPVAGCAGAGVAHMRVSAASKRSCQTPNMPVFDPESFVSGILCDRRLLESALEGVLGGHAGTAGSRCGLGCLCFCGELECNAMRNMGSLFGRISLLSRSACGSFVQHDKQGYYGESVDGCGRGKRGSAQVV